MYKVCIIVFHRIIKVVYVSKFWSYDKYTIIHTLYDYDIIIIFLLYKHSISGRVLVETSCLSDIRTSSIFSIIKETRLTTLYDKK